MSTGAVRNASRFGQRSLLNSAEVESYQHIEGSGIRRTRALNRSTNQPIDRILTAIMLTLGLGALSHLSETGLLDGTVSDSPMTQGLWALLITAALLRLPRGSHSLREWLTSIGWPLVAFAALSVVSFIWSINPALTLRRSIALSGTLVMGTYIATRLSPQVLGRIAVLSTTLTSALSLLAVGANLSWARGADGSSIGLLTHRNSLGAVAATGLLMSAIGAFDVTRFYLWVSRVILVATLVISDSRTSMLAATLSISSIFVLRILKNSRPLGTAALLICTAIALTGLKLIGGANGIFESVGRSADLTGRGRLWPLISKLAMDRPYSGYGYGVVWGKDSPATQMIQPVFPSIRSAHNILLEARLEIGYAGAILIVLTLALALGRGAKLTLRSDSRRFSSGGELTFGLAVFLSVRGIAESGFPSRNSLATILLVACLCQSFWLQKECLGPAEGRRLRAEIV